MGMVLTLCPYQGIAAFCTLFCAEESMAGDHILLRSSSFFSLAVRNS